MNEEENMNQGAQPPGESGVSRYNNMIDLRTNEMPHQFNVTSIYQYFAVPSAFVKLIHSWGQGSGSPAEHKQLMPQAYPRDSDSVTLE